MNNYWKPCLALIGQNQLNKIQEGADNIMRSTIFRMSLRIPPTFIPDDAEKILTQFFQDK